ncbi:hypothetical protein GCM10011413_02160 [Pedobacter psychrotolerans]|nr:hypothetical protein GCM10011413_02160 [Pedobacter psychrotolerans]
MQENNKSVDKFNTSELYPNKKQAYVKNGDVVLLYAPTNRHIVYMETNLKSYTFDVRDPLLFNTNDLIMISNTKYFLPKKYSTFYKYSINQSGTAGGDFFTFIEFNDLGLMRSIEKNLPNGKSKYSYEYNKYGQLLKIIEDKIIDKTLMENKYDEKARLVEQEKNYSELKSKRTYTYNDKDQIVKESVWQKEIAPNGNIIRDERYILNYEYDSKNQLVKRQSEDGKKSFQYNYNEKSLLVKELIYETIYKKEEETAKTTVINDFKENLLEYDEENKLVKEIKKEAHFNNSTKLVNQQWQDLNEKEQTEYAWEEYKKNKNFFTSITNFSYQYSGKNLTKSTKKVINHFSNGNKYVEEEQIYLQEKINYAYNNLGQIVKKEIISNNSDESETYSY